jgi:hypothetical protein
VEWVAAVEGGEGRRRAKGIASGKTRLGNVEGTREDRIPPSFGELDEVDDEVALLVVGGVRMGMRQGPSCGWPTWEWPPTPATPGLTLLLRLLSIFLHLLI